MGLEIKKEDDADLDVSITIPYTGKLNPQDPDGYSFRTKKTASSTSATPVEIGRLKVTVDTCILVKGFIFAKGSNNDGRAVWDIMVLIDIDGSLNKTVVGQSIQKLNNATALTWAVSADGVSVSDAIVVLGTGAVGANIDWGFVPTAVTRFSTT